MQSFSDSFHTDPRAKQLLEDQEAIRHLLSDPETKKLLQSLRKKNTQQLRSAAQAALQGDVSALTDVMKRLTEDPQATQAMEKLNQNLGR